MLSRKDYSRVLHEKEMGKTHQLQNG